LIIEGIKIYPDSQKKITIIIGSISIYIIIWEGKGDTGGHESARKKSQVKED